MKHIKLIILVAILAFLGCTANAQVEWKTIEEAAKVDTKTNQKLFFIDFSTSWCGWCKKMDKETFSDPVVAAILNKYYIPVHFDAEGDAQFVWDDREFKGAGMLSNGRKGTHPFTFAVLGKNVGYPSCAFFAKDRHLIQILQGYHSAYDFQMVLWYFANGDTERYTFDQYQQVFDSKIKPNMMKKLGLAK